MIVKILSSSATFRGVSYNTSKIDRNKGELMKLSNFGMLSAMDRVRPEDLRNYLKMCSARNSRVSKPQFHAVISAKGKNVSKYQLTKLAESWLAKMGYADQPYLIVYHKDTENNHVHMVSTRIARDGRTISDRFERLRSLKTMEDLLYGHALRYHFSTRAQLATLLECEGLDAALIDEERIAKRLSAYRPDLGRQQILKELFRRHRSEAELKSFGIERTIYPGICLYQMAVPLLHLWAALRRKIAPARRPYLLNLIVAV